MRKWHERVYYTVERGYPYVIAVLIVLFCCKAKFNMMRAENNYTELLNGLITLDSIIIGFLGAVMPVILSMKNESRFVRYVFEKDKDNLFCKYLKITLLLGICDAVLSLIMHVRQTIPVEYKMNFYYVWIFLTVAFLMSTYRSMSHMIALIFTKDCQNVDDNDGRLVSQERENELKMKYKSD